MTDARPFQRFGSRISMYMYMQQKQTEENWREREKNGRNDGASPKQKGISWVRASPWEMVRVAIAFDAKKRRKKGIPFYKSSIQFLATNSKILEIELVGASSCLIQRETTFSNFFFSFTLLVLLRVFWAKYKVKEIFQYNYYQHLNQKSSTVILLDVATILALEVRRVQTKRFTLQKILHTFSL